MGEKLKGDIADKLTLWSDYDLIQMAKDMREAAAEIRTLRARLRDAERAIKPKPIRFAPKDRKIIGVERPPLESNTFYYEVQWSEKHEAFMTCDHCAFNGATHYIDPADFPGIIWPREKAASKEAT
jgi:hypothetical protein